MYEVNVGDKFICIDIDSTDEPYTIGKEYELVDIKSKAMWPYIMTSDDVFNETGPHNYIEFIGQKGRTWSALFNWEVIRGAITSISVSIRKGSSTETVTWLSNDLPL